jgi:PAS domain S-box-containing protein
MSDTLIQILLVEDNSADAALLTRELAESSFGPFSITHVKRLEEALGLLQRQPFDAVLLDLGLPDSQGLATLARLQKQKPRGIPIIVLTGLDDGSLWIQALREGAEDYLVKDGSAANLRARSIRYAIERNRCNAAFAASEQQLALVVDAVQMGIFEWTVQTGKVKWSHHHARLFGLMLEEFDGTYATFERCVHPDDVAGVKANVEKSLAARTEYNHEYRIVWRDGSEHWIETRGQVFGDSQGQTLRMMGTVADISPRKAAEESARIREVELAHLSRIATMGHMASGLAHELNQPLAAILNYASVCLDQIESGKGSPAAALTAIQELMNETRRAGALISRMRSFVRKQEPQSVPLDINELVRVSLSMMEFELRRQRIRPHLELDANLPKVLGDAVQIEQVLINLLFNALEAMSDGTSRRNALMLRTALHDEGRSVQVCIVDTGSGMSPENLSRLFEPFFTTKAKGLGMGLNISRSIIETLGGRLSAATNSDRGMQFCFTVPVAEGAGS